jgi:hypothetical protein
MLLLYTIKYPLIPSCIREYRDVVSKPRQRIQYGSIHRYIQSTAHDRIFDNKQNVRPAHLSLNAQLVPINDNGALQHLIPILFSSAFGKNPLQNQVHEAMKHAKTKAEEE